MIVVTYLSIILTMTIHIAQSDFYSKYVYSKWKDDSNKMIISIKFKNSDGDGDTSYDIGVIVRQDKLDCYRILCKVFLIRPEQQIHHE